MTKRNRPPEGGERDRPLPPSVAVRRMAKKRGEPLGREAADDVEVSEVSPARVAHPRGETRDEPKGLGR